MIVDVGVVRGSTGHGCHRQRHLLDFMMAIQNFSLRPGRYNSPSRVSEFPALMSFDMLRSQTIKWRLATYSLAFFEQLAYRLE